MTRPKRFRSWTVAEFLEALGAVLIVNNNDDFSEGDVSDINAASL